MNENHILEISCEHVVLQISNYIDGELTAALRAQMEDHIRGCKHCSAVLDGTSNTLQLLADGMAFDHLFPLPSGFGERLRQRLASHLASS